MNFINGFLFIDIESSSHDVVVPGVELRLCDVFSRGGILGHTEFCTQRYYCSQQILVKRCVVLIFTIFENSTRNLIKLVAHWINFVNRVKHKITWIVDFITQTDILTQCLSMLGTFKRAKFFNECLSLLCNVFLFRKNLLESVCFHCF